MLRRWNIALLLAIHAALLGWAGWGTCPNKAEVGYMAATVYWWHTLHFDVFHVNPPLTRIVTALPIAMCDPKQDWRSYSSRPQDRSEWGLGRAFIVANSPEKIRWCFALARWSLIPLVLLGGYFGYRLAREMFGVQAGFVFLALWCFSPLLVAWGATICPDVIAGGLGLVAIYTFRRWLHQPDWTRAAISGVCLGLLPLTKLTWIIAFGVWPLMWCFWMIPTLLTQPEKRCFPWPPLRQLAAILFLALYTLNMGYLFDETCRPLGRYVFISRLLGGHIVPGNPNTLVPGNRFAGTRLGAILVPLPADFVQGIDTQRFDFERGLPSYLRGQWAAHGWWYYYLYALAVKEPLGTWCLATLALAASILGRGFSASWRDEMLVLVPFAAILVFVSSQSGFSAHSRYVIPALPFLFVWASKVGRVFQTRLFAGRRLALAAMVVLALVWSVASSLAVYPHSLSYFNELAALLPMPAEWSYPKPVSGAEVNQSLLSRIQCVLTAGPRNGPRHLLGSNIDWGQDLFCLEEWCRLHPEAQPIQVAYFGGYPVERSNIKSSGNPPIGVEWKQFDNMTDLAAYGPLPGWYALSVNEIYSRSQQYRYFLNFQPVATAGYSIYIYHITLDEANRVRRKLGLPELAKDRRAAQEPNREG
jgi:hypothetical protein